MKIGVPKEIKTNENRIALVPAGAETLVARATPCSSSRAPATAAGSRTRRTTAVGATILADGRRGVGARPR